MVSTVLLAIGLVLIVEGLVFALAPSRMDDLLRLIAQLPIETRRLIGLLALVGGTILVMLARML